MNRSGEKGASPFVTPTAVEAWDSWFRWRENGALRDDTVEATWQRVAAALAAVEADDTRPFFARRLLEAFADWRLLLDERILASAGTGMGAWCDDEPVAVLNIASFVRSTALSQAAIDFTAIKNCAELAVHALDNALLMQASSRQSAKRLRVGIIGLANALALLHLEYDSAEARIQVQRIAQALAEGCLSATIALAETRGPAMHCDASWLERASLRCTPPDLVERALRCGLRHDGLTSITSQPRLARFANDAADAIYPLPANSSLAAAVHSGLRLDLPTAVPVPVQIEMRGAMQPWIDEPISCPLQSTGKPALTSHLDWYARAVGLGLGALSWRS